MPYEKNPVGQTRDKDKILSLEKIDLLTCFYLVVIVMISSQWILEKVGRHLRQIVEADDFC